MFIYYFCFIMYLFLNWFIFVLQFIIFILKFIYLFFVLKCIYFIILLFHYLFIYLIFLLINIKYLLTKQTDGLLTGVNLKLTTHWSGADTARLWTHPNRKEMFYWMTTQILREVIHLKHFMSYSIWLAARDLSYAPSHRQDSTYHGLCYTSCEAPECPNNYGSEINFGCCIFCYIYHF